MQYFDFLACSRLMCFRVFVFVSWLAKASKTQSLKASNLQVASAGDAKRKQSARPSVRMSEGVLDLAHRLSSLKSLLTGVRVTRRGNRLDLFFFIIFFDLIFSWQNPPQGASKEHPRDSKIIENPTFCSKSRPQDPSSIGFSVDLCFSHFLGRFVVCFSWKND